MAVIHSGLTNVVQSLNVLINKTFKYNIRRKSSVWRLEEEKALTKLLRMKAPDLSPFCLWVNGAWAEIDTNLIVKSIKKCSMWNAMDELKMILFTKMLMSNLSKI